MNLLQTSKLFMKRNGSTVLTCLGAVGVVVTAVTAVKATPKAMLLLEQAEEEKGGELTRLETVKVAGPAYIPSIVIGVSTIACVLGSNILNKRQQASLASAYALVDSSYREYKNKVVELYGEDADKEIKREIVKAKPRECKFETNGEKRLFYDFYSRRYFESTLEQVQNAEYFANRELRMKDCLSVNEFYELLGLEPLLEGDELGWSTEACFAFDYNAWIDFDHEKVELEDGLECIIISMFTEPVWNFYTY